MIRLYGRVAGAAMRVAVSAAALGLVAGEARSQSAWRPDKPVELIVPTAAGGNNDRITRLIQKVLQDQKLVATPIVVLNKPGGNQHLAVVHLNQRPGDAHYVMFTNPTLFTNELAGITQQHYTSLTPLALLVVETTVLTVRADSPFRNVRELVDRLKTDPDSVSFGMASRGGTPHLTLAAAARAVNLDPKKLKIVVFKTSAEAVTAIAGGHINVMASSVSSVLAQVKAGNARILGAAAAQRLPGAIAHVPTLREQGIDSTGVSAWRALFGAKGLAAAQIAFWDDALAKVVESADWKMLLEQSDLVSHFMRSKEFSTYLEHEYKATRAVMAELGLAK